jgi:hypothetical protein
LDKNEPAHCHLHCLSVKSIRLFRFLPIVILLLFFFSGHAAGSSSGWVFLCGVHSRRFELPDVEKVQTSRTRTSPSSTAFIRHGMA